MKKLLIMLLAAALCLAPALAEANPLGEGSGREVDRLVTPRSLLAGGGDQVALDDLGIAVSVEDYVAIRQTDGFVYVYTWEDGAIPYVIIGAYDFVDEDFPGLFTDYMAGSYPDLAVTQPASRVTLGGDSFERIGYQYAVSGYTVEDTRLFLEWNERTYMLGAKQVPALGYSLPDGALERIAASLAPIVGGEDAYARHVDSTRSAFKNAPVDLGGLGGDALGGGVEPESGEEGGAVGGTVGGVSRQEPPQEESVGRIDFDESLAPFAGTWVEFDDGFKLYLPSEWNRYEPTEEASAAGTLYIAGDGETFIIVNWAYDDSVSTMDDVLDAMLAEGGYASEGMLDINGIRCLAFSGDGGELSGVAFLHSEYPNYAFAVVAEPMTGNEDTLNAILCSLSPR